MSETKPNTDYIILITLTVITVVFLTVFAALDWLEKDTPGFPGIRTTYSTNVGAILICYTLYERLGISVNRSVEMLQENTLDKADVLFFLNPFIPLKKLELQVLEAWLEQGGVLITTRRMPGLHKAFDAMEKCCREEEQEDTEKEKTVTTPGKQKKDSKSVITHADGSRHPLDNDVYDVQFSGDNVIAFEPTENEGDPKIELEELFADTKGLRIAGFRLGAGHIIYISDSSFLTNGKIGKADNAILSVNLVAWALNGLDSKRVIFDEYHLGFGHHETGFDVAGDMLFNTSAGWAVLSLTVSVLLFLIYKGRRFGPRRGLDAEQRRSKIEFIQAVGATYRSAGANRLTLEIIYRFIRSKMVHSVGLPKTASNRAIDELMSKRSGKKKGVFMDIMDECDDLLLMDKISERKFLSAVKKLGQIDSEV